jgi:hypothetical protein
VGLTRDEDKPEPVRPKSQYTAKDRAYVRYCLRYAVAVLGKAGVLAYVEALDRNGDER